MTTVGLPSAVCWRGIGFTENCQLEKNSPQTFQPAGCPVDWLGLTEVVTRVAPRSLRCRTQRVYSGSAHIHGLFARDVPDSPDQRFLENSA